MKVRRGGNEGSRGSLVPCNQHVAEAGSVGLLGPSALVSAFRTDKCWCLPVLLVDGLVVIIAD